jgi:hypothetical protein
MSVALSVRYQQPLAMSVDAWPDVLQQCQFTGLDGLTSVHAQVVGAVVAVALGRFHSNMLMADRRRLCSGGHRLDAARLRRTATGNMKLVRYLAHVVQSKSGPCFRLRSCDVGGCGASKLLVMLAAAAPQLPSSLSGVEPLSKKREANSRQSDTCAASTPPPDSKCE